MAQEPLPPEDTAAYYKNTTCQMCGTSNCRIQSAKVVCNTCGAIVKMTQPTHTRDPIPAYNTQTMLVKEPLKFGSSNVKPRGK